MTTITQERTKLKAVGRSLRSREQAGFRGTMYTRANAVTEPSSLVFIHITITNPRSYSSDDAHARAVEAIGISRFPNTGVSYNRLIMQSGASYEGQPIGRQGAHTVNNKNVTTCPTSGCPGRGTSLPSASTNLNDVVRAYAICQNVSDAVTAAELDALARTVAADILAGFVTRNFRLHGHRCVAPKDCPGAKMWALMASLKTKINHYVAVGFGTVTPPKEWDEMATEAQVEAAAYRADYRYGIDFWIEGTGAALIRQVNAIAAATVANGNAIAALAAKIATEDVADDNEFRAAVAEIKAADAAIKASVDALAAQQAEAGLPKA